MQWAMRNHLDMVLAIGRPTARHPRPPAAAPISPAVTIAWAMGAPPVPRWRIRTRTVTT
jgi:hypothetical protein